MPEWYGTADLARDLGLTPEAVRRLLRRRGFAAGRGRRYQWPKSGYLDLVRQIRGDTTVDEAEVRAFSELADRWWDENGPLAMLHRLNPVRLSYIRRQLIGQFRLDGERARPLEGLTILDAGCGGGLVTEPLARLGATMTGLDASGEAIAVARRHATLSGLAIDWRQGTLEEMALTSPAYDALVALEIVEHVTSLETFVVAAVRCVKPGGVIIFSTLNRTLRSLLLAKITAEYIARLVPRGTHDVSRFVRPVELVRTCRRSGARLTDVTGLAFHVIDNRWRLSPDSSVNYMATAVTGRSSPVRSAISRGGCSPRPCGPRTAP